MAELNATVLLNNSAIVFHNNNNNNRNCTNGTNSGKEEEVYDAEGALKFTVAVVVVYGVAVMGVFVMGYFGRKRRNNADLDQQANNFLRNLEQVRNKIEKENEISKVRGYLDSYRYRLSTDGTLDRRPASSTSLFIESEKVSETSLISDSSKLYINSPDELSPLHEEDEDDSVFMTEEERERYGVDMYMNVRESDIC